MNASGTHAQKMLTVTTCQEHSSVSVRLQDSDKLDQWNAKVRYPCESAQIYSGQKKKELDGQTGDRIQGKQHKINTKCDLFF